MLVLLLLLLVLFLLLIYLHYVVEVLVLIQLRLLALSLVRESRLGLRVLEVLLSASLGSLLARGLPSLLQVVVLDEVLGRSIVDIGLVLVLLRLLRDVEVAELKIIIYHILNA